MAYRLLGSSADVEVLDVTTDETFYGNISDSNVVRYGTGFYFPFSNDRPLAYGATGTGSIVAVSGTATPATATGSHTIADGDNLVIASVGMGLTTSGATTVGAFTVTYGGVPMTPVGSLATATLATSTKGQVQQFYLLDPPSGPQATTVSATFTSNANAAHSSVFIDTVSYSGAGTPTGAVSAGGTSTASNRIAVGPVAAGDMAHFTHYIWASTSNTLTPYT